MDYEIAVQPNANVKKADAPVCPPTEIKMLDRIPSVIF
jgi:hypothetical protein